MPLLVQTKFVFWKYLFTNSSKTLYNFPACYKDVHSSDGGGVSVGKKKKMEPLFLDSNVQSILKKITGLDYEKIFKPVKQKLEPFLYYFVTDKQLKERHENTRLKAIAKLQMPPVMDIREPIDEIMAREPELQGFERAKVVFTDISQGVSNRDRFITVRETDGTLRKANWDERFRMNQIYYPSPGRSLLIPKLFETPYLDRLLDEESYIYVLDRACVQFEPDDPEYHRVTHSTYDHISERKQFDVLRSTRHFGPMAFYFAYSNNAERLMVDMIERELIDDAADLVKLLCIMHPDASFALQKERDISSLELVTEFMQSNASKHRSDLELAVQTYSEIHSNAIESKITA